MAMSSDKENPVILCQDTLVRLSGEVLLPDGTLLPEGTLVLLLPQTVAECVLTPDGISLADSWSSLSKSGHTHNEVIAFSEQLARFADRLAKVETALVTTTSGTVTGA